MFGLNMLDVTIGLITIYLSFGIACTAIVEAISSLTSLRGRDLQRGLKEFFKGFSSEENHKKTHFADAFYAHPLIKTLRKGDKGRPSYIPTKIVGSVVVSLLKLDGSADNLKKALEALPGKNPGDNQIKDLLLDFYKEAKGDIIEFKNKIETHFDLSMERVTGWFKRTTQYTSLIISICLVSIANVDTIDIANSLAINPEARAVIVKLAGKLLSQQKTIESQLAIKPDQSENIINNIEKAQKSYDNAVKEAVQAGLNLGWEGIELCEINWLSKIIGLIVSGFAVSLGAPFWFEILQRFMNIRGAGAQYNKKDES